MHITPVYAAAVTLLFVGLSVRTLRLRRTLGIALGDAGNPRMLRAIRVHANCAEYGPIGLVLLFLVESVGANALLVHALGASLVLGRFSHAFGVSQPDEEYAFRVAGMALTFGTLLTSAGYLLVMSVVDAL